VTRPLGGYIGFNRVPTSSAASGVWTLREQERFKRAGTWPAFFSPAGIADLLAWYDASDSGTLFSNDAATSGVSADGQVAVWLDKSPNGNNLTQQTGANRPLYRTGSIGGLPALDFNGSSTSIATRDGSNNLSFPIDLAASKEISIFCVSIAATSTGYRAFSFKRNNAPDFISGVVVPTDTANRFDFTIGSGTTTSSTVSDYRDYRANATATNSHILAITYSNSSDLLFRYNGSTITATSPHGGSLAAGLWLSQGSGNHNLCVGARGFDSNNNLGGFMNGRIAELIFYTRAVTTSEREGIESYLSVKYGISL